MRSGWLVVNGDRAPVQEGEHVLEMDDGDSYATV